MKVLTAFYDLAVSPVSYDFVNFLAGTASVQRAKGCDHTHVIFVPADTESGFRIDNKPTTTENKNWRLHNLLVPLCRLIGATSTVLPCRDHQLKSDIAHPFDWTNEQPTAAYWYREVARIIGFYGLVPFQVDAEAQRFVRSELIPSNYVTITIRETYNAPLNSQLAEWRFMAGWLEEQGQRVVWVPDTEHAVAPEIEPIATAAALNPLVRHALYANAKMNLGVGGGTQTLCWFGGLPFLSFRMLKDSPNATPEFYKRLGMPVGYQMPWADENQRFVWEGSDTFDNIKQHYTEWSNHASRVHRVRPAPDHLVHGPAKFADLTGN